MAAVKQNMDPASQPLSSKPPRRRARWYVLGTIALVFLSGGAIFLDAWIGAGTVIEQEKIRVAERTARFRDERASWPSLFEPAEDGNVWEPFREALKGLSSFTVSDLDAFPSLSSNEGPLFSDEALALMLVRFKPVLDHLERAFRRRDVEPRSSYEDLGEMRLPYVSDCIRLNRMLVDLAAHCNRMGNDREALDLLAIAYWSGGILSAKGVLVDELVRLVIHGMFKESLKQLVQEYQGSASDFQRFGKMLDRLETSQPPLSVILRRESLVMRHFFLKCVREWRPFEKGDPFGTGEREGLRRHLPTRIRVAQWFRWKDEMDIGFDRIETLPSWERAEAVTKLIEAAPVEPIPLMTGQVSRAYRNWLINRRDMTLARLAVALAAHGAEKGVYPAALSDLAPQFVERIPVDPWNGRAFRYFNKGTSATLYSFGGDGDDDGGIPVSDDDMDDEDGDIVWTVKRRETPSK